MVRTGPKKPIGSDWMPIEEIRGIPNILTSSVRVHKWKESYRQKGQKIPKTRPCIFCGRWFRNHRSLAAHLNQCQKRKMYYQMLRDGWRFDIADKSFVLRSDCWGYIREAVSLEKSLNDEIATGRISDDAAVRLFYVHIRAHVASWHNSRTGIVSLPWDPSPDETGPDPAAPVE